MSTVIEIEKAIEQLPEEEQRKLAAWFDEQRFIVESSAALASIYDDENGGEGNTLGTSLRTSGFAEWETATSYCSNGSRTVRKSNLRKSRSRE